jgi:CRISPR-associated protein Cmr4
VTDHHLALLPTPTDQGTFGWLTCPLVLARLLRDVGKPPFAVPAVGQGEALATPALGQKEVALGDLLLKRKELDPKLAETLAGWIFPEEPWWKERLRAHLVVVSDDVFTFLARHRTDVRAHVRIDPEAGTVAKGGLWYEESLPAESVLCGVLQLHDNGKLEGLPSDAVLRLAKLDLQVGGNATTGAGRCRLRLVGGAR